MWWSSSSGLIELNIPRRVVSSCTHSGPCDADVLAASKLPRLRAQLNKIDSGLLARELAEYGAWDETELADHAQNIQRLLWVACGDLFDNLHLSREYDR